MSLLPDYSGQAQRYDETRSASPSVLRPLREALKDAPGSRLADLGGGTGNYALALSREGWVPVVVDRSVEMLVQAADKGLETVEADAERLPFENESFDAVTMISMLHHVEDHGAALTEARRILRRGGRLALMGFTDKDAASLWVLDYFPSSRQWMKVTHPPLAEVLEELPGARLLDFEFEDMEDASLAHCRPTLSGCSRRPRRGRRAISNGCSATTQTSCEPDLPGCARTSRLVTPQRARALPRCSAGQSRDAPALREDRHSARPQRSCRNGRKGQRKRGTADRQSRAVASGSSLGCPLRGLLLVVALVLGLGESGPSRIDTLAAQKRGLDGHDLFNGLLVREDVALGWLYSLHPLTLLTRS